MTQSRIAIVGGGPAGLTLGRLLCRRNITFTIFELRQKPTQEELAKPCGVLDLHDESGQAALKECGLYDDFLKLTGECAEAQRVSNMEGTILYADEGELSERPEISRNALTALLLESLPAHTIKWNHKLSSASYSAGRTELDFGPNGKHTFDLVVGADGAWSKIRNLVTKEKPAYAGVHNITLTIRNVTTKYPDLAEFVGPGSFSALGLNHGVMSQRGPQDSARIYCFLTTKEDFPSSSGLGGKSAMAVQDKLLSDDTLIGRWGPKIKDLLKTACNEEAADNPDEEADIKAMYSLAVGHSWEHRPGLTLIGDAAHLMCPWAGEGVNLAMWDSLDLSRAVHQATEVSEGDSCFRDALEPLIKTFEDTMLSRAKDKAEETERNGQMLLSDNAANEFVKFFESAYGPRPDEARPE